MALLTPVIAGFPAILKSRAPSDRLNVGLIGCRNRGFRVLQHHLDQENVECLALCDVDDKVLQEKKEVLGKKHHQEPKVFKDFRKLLEQKDIDAVIVGTPDHWHCLMTVLACESGKDVYVEKPMANSIKEGAIIVQAAKDYQRIVQVGQQQRSGLLWNEVMEFIKSGQLGHIRKTNIWANFNYGLGPAKKPDAPTPAGVDYDMYLGPAPLRPFNPSRFHGVWRHFWDYGGGLMTDWGVHLIDMALWAKDITSPPETVLAYGSNLDRPDLAKETYDTMSVIYTFGDYLVQWESSAGKQVGPYNRLYGLAFLGDNGTLVADRKGWEVLPEYDDKTKKNKMAAFTSPAFQGGTDLHVKNFIASVKDRSAPACPPELGHNVALCAHSANIAIRSNQFKLQWNQSQAKFKNAREANLLLQPSYRRPWRLPRI